MYIADIEKDFLTECKEDYVGLWGLVRAFRDAKPELSNDGICIEVLSLLENLLKKNEIIVGEPNESGDFVEWGLSEEECINKIKILWSELGRDPDVGEVAWFTSFDG